MLTAIVAVFILGYLCIALENFLKINKAAIALITGVLCWTLYILSQAEKEAVAGELIEHMGNLSQILFFLLGAMTIVELVDAHDGFEIITRRITTKSKRKLIWIICLLAFFLSAILDNLTTAIVMISLVRKLMTSREDRLMFSGAVIIAANAGGAWSPIGDVTTTMLWIGGQITSLNIILKLFLPSVACLVVPVLMLQFTLKGKVEAFANDAYDTEEKPLTDRHKNIVFWTGLVILLLVPVFKTVTHLPPVMGMLLGLGLLWVIVEILHSEKDEQDRKPYTVAHALRKIDSSSILFFLGILLAISVLESTHQLSKLATWMNTTLKDEDIIVMTIGLFSAIVDNVPLVAAAMGMYHLEQYPQNHSLWEFLAYCTGTGGSVLLIGSAAGVAAMGIEKIDFLWYLKRISWLALAGYFAGAMVYLLQNRLLS